jgi:hypothetical protein
VYLNAAEQNSLRYLEIGAFALFLVTGLMMNHAEHPRQLAELRSESLVFIIHSSPSLVGPPSAERSERREHQSATSPNDKTVKSA